MFGSLDFVYLPSHDVAADVTHFTEALGTRLVWAIEAFGTRVAMVQPAESSPPLLLAGHLAGDQPVLVYRVGDLEGTIAGLQARGTEIGPRFEIPHGPGVELVLPGPQRVALYQLSRPGVADRFNGRRDF